MSQHLWRNITFHAAHFWIEEKNTPVNTASNWEKDREGLKDREVNICYSAHHTAAGWLIQALHSRLKGVTVVWQQTAKRPCIIIVYSHLSNRQQGQKDVGFTSCSSADITQCKINTEVIHISLQRHPTRSAFDSANQMQPFLHTHTYTAVMYVLLWTSSHAS